MLQFVGLGLELLAYLAKKLISVLQPVGCDLPTLLISHEDFSIILLIGVSQSKWEAVHQRKVVPLSSQFLALTVNSIRGNYSTTEGWSSLKTIELKDNEINEGLN